MRCLSHDDQQPTFSEVLSANQQLFLHDQTGCYMPLLTIRSLIRFLTAHQGTLRRSKFTSVGQCLVRKNCELTWVGSTFVAQSMACQPACMPACHCTVYSTLLHVDNRLSVSREWTVTIFRLSSSNEQIKFQNQMSTIG